MSQTGENDGRAVGVETPPAGWRVGEDGVWRRETGHSMLRRLNDWDYRQPWIYQITLVCADRRAAPLGAIEVRRRVGEGGAPANGGATVDVGVSVEGRASVDGDWSSLAAARGRVAAPEETEARVALSPLGSAISDLFWRFGDHTPEVKPLACQIMPDHMHFIIRVTRAMKRPLGNAIGGFKTGCEKLNQKLSLLAQNGSGAGRGFGRGVGAGKGFGRGVGAGKGPGCGVGVGKGPGCGVGAANPTRLFAEGFQDSILFREGQLGAMFAYLADNPRRRAIKALFPDLFRVVRKMALPLWLSPQARNGDAGEARQYHGAGGEARRRFGDAGGGGLVPRARARGWFAALGNRFLLDRPLAQVQVSRRDFAWRREPKPGGGLKICRDAKGEPIVDFATPLFAEKRADLFAAAKRGAVLISPCVSDGERQIAREALAAGLPLVALKNKGFSPLEKPAGRLFDACADGRLLLLAPAAWPYVPGEKKMTRVDATALNRLCQWLVGEDAAEINYHGMRPVNIDACARAAACVERAGNEQGGRV